MTALLPSPLPKARGALSPRPERSCWGESSLVLRKLRVHCGLHRGLPRRQGVTQLSLWATDWLILQGPATPVFEGDPLVLRCQAWRGWPLARVTFYRDGSALGAPGPHREFTIAVVREADSGHYHCSAVFRSPGPGSPETASSVAVTVQGEGSGQSLCEPWQGGQRPASSRRAGAPQPLGPPSPGGPSLPRILVDD